MTYLIDHPPVRDQFRSPRRDSLSGVIVVHTAESTPDYVAFDGGAEAVARFIQNRPDAGSYHDLVDSDSAIDLISYDDEAYHDGTGSNRHSLGLSIATRADVWPLAPQAWRDGAIEQAAQRAARMARHVKARTGIVVPARRITRSESELRLPGFISHAERDPERRTDPGKDFPWSQFLARYAELMTPLPAPTPPPTQEDDMPTHYKPPKGHPDAGGTAPVFDGDTTWLVQGNLRWVVPTKGYHDALVADGFPPKTPSHATWDCIRAVTKIA